MSDPTLVLGPSPCEGCRFREHCARDRLACERFMLFVHGASIARWRHAPRVPARATFDHIFRGETARACHPAARQGMG